MTGSSRACAFAAVAILAPAAAVAAPSSRTSGKADAPGQVCKHLNLNGGKTDEQRVTFKNCVHDAVAKRKPDIAAKAENEDANAGTSARSGKPDAPGQVCKHLKVKGKKTDRQRAAFKRCIQDVVATRKG